MIELDGSFGEGGGQILRTALALAAILRKPFTIRNIRKGRKRPGLAAQHLTTVRAVAKVSNAQLVGDQFGSESLNFIPEGIRAGKYEFDVAAEKGSAGAVTLVAQSLLPVLFFAQQESEVKLRGGTHVPFSPTFDYLKEILLPTIKRLGYEAEAEIIRYGFYPVGGGEITIKTKPFSPNKCHLSSETKRGELKSLKITSRVANLPLSIAERQARRALALLTPHFKVDEVITEICPANSSGTYLFIKATFPNAVSGFSSLGEKGKPAERVAEEAVDEFLKYLKTESLFDPHLADQILLFLALITDTQRKGTFSFTTSQITNHLITNIWTIKRFLEVEITFSGELGKVGRVVVNPQI